MGVRSMTGCGAGAAERGGVRVEVSLASVNRKGLDVQVSVPRGYPALEAAVARGVASRLARGRVTGEVRVDARGAGGGARVDWALAESVADAARQLGERLGLEGGAKVSDVLNFPGVLSDEGGAGAESAEAALGEALAAALDALVAFREREGAALAEDLLPRVAALEALRGELAERAPAVAAGYGERVKKRVAEALAEAGLPMGAETEERIVREAALFADRADVTEELVRLASHLAQMASALRGEGAVGRQLDFLAQEAGREINTIGSKSNDAEMARRVVAFKAELERVREQIQNIE